MSVKVAALSATGLVAITLMFFDVDINPQFSMPRTVELPDIDQESRFSACVDQKDSLIHAETFGSIDNPDVQREILMTEKERAIRDCRTQFPQKQATREQPFHFNIIDIRYRY